DPRHAPHDAGRRRADARSACRPAGSGGGPRMSDELPTAARVADPGIRALYRLENRWQAWLDVEVALAKAQAELGIIPAQAAAAPARTRRSAPRARRYRPGSAGTSAWCR